MLEVIELKPSTAPSWVIIAMHGLGADGSDLIDGNSLLGFNFKNPVTYLFPNAPQRFVSFAGTTLPAWFEINDFSSRIPEEDTNSLTASVSEIHLLIEQTLLKNQIPSDHLILLGFSQGGVLALAAGLTYPQRLGGIVSLSAWLPNSFMAKPLPGFSLNTPIFFGYGKNDELIPAAWTEASIAALERGDTRLTHKQYAHLGHGINLLEQQDLQNWLSSLIDR